jgi:hypothetical protein
MRIPILLGYVYELLNSELIGFWTSSTVRYSKEHDVSETGFLRPQVKGEDTYSDGSPVDGNRFVCLATGP